MSVTIEVEGVNAVQQAMSKAGDRYDQALSAALYQKGFDIDRDAVKIVPVDTGRLRGSHYVSPPKVGTGKKLYCEVGFGTRYGLPVHEKDNPPGRTKGQSNKYLETPFNEHGKNLRTWLSKRAKKNYKAGIGVNAIPAVAPQRPKE